MKNIFLLFALPFFLNHSIHAQGILQIGAPLVDDRGYDLLFAADGGFVTSGYKGNNAVLYKSDCAGNLLAQIEKPFPAGPGRFFDAVQLPDGSIVAVGSAAIATPTDTLERVFLLKTSPSLVEIAASDFLILNKTARAKSVTLTPNGDLLLLGEVTGASFNFTDVFLLRVNATTLQPIGSPVIYNDGVDLAEEIIRTADGNYLLAGSSFSGNIFNPNAVIINRLQAVKINESGALIWQYAYQDSFPAQYEVARVAGVEQNPVSGNFMLSGTTYGGSPDMHQDAIFILIGNNGAFLDSALLQSPLQQSIYGMTGYADLPGLYLAGGGSDNPVFDAPNLFVTQAYEINGQIAQSTLANDIASPLILTDVIEIGQNNLAGIAAVPDNPGNLELKDIIVVTPQIGNIDILYQNCALVASFNASNPTYQWFLNEMPIPGATSGFYFPSQSGVYQVLITDAIGCFGISDTFTVALASAGFDVTTDNLTAAFSNTSAGATSYQWNFGDGQTSTQDNPVHDYATGGVYTVTLIAGSPCGADTLMQTIGLTGSGEPSRPGYLRLFPNPNAGVFSVEIHGVPQEELVLSLLNPTGQVIDRQSVDFQTGNLRHDFDCSHLPPGIYTLQVQAKNETRYVKVVLGQ